MRDKQIWAPLLAEVAERAARYLEGLDARRVFPDARALAALRRLAGPLPEEGLDPHEVLARLDEAASPATVASAGGRYFGFVTGGCLPACLAANWLAGAWDQNCFSWTSSPVGAALEETVLAWLLDVFDLPAGCEGALVTGATMANFTGLAAARRHVLLGLDWDVEEKGLFGAPPVSVVVGEEAHSTLFKALGLLGLGRERVLVVPTDAQGRMRADRLPAIEPPAIVCLQAGNVNSGAFDPVAAIAAPARERGAWIHVDGAFGLWARASSQLSALSGGLELADSWATDAHKWLNVPYDSGLAFVRHPGALRGAMSQSAAYLPGEERRHPYDSTPESSRRCRGVELWAALLGLGRRGVAELVERNCRQARRFAEGLAEAGYDVLNDVVLNQVLVAFGDDERTNAVLRLIQEEGTCWCGGTVWHGRSAMRISVSSWGTTDEDVERSLEAMLRAAARS